MKTALRVVLIAICLLGFRLPASGEDATGSRGAPPGWPQPIEDSKIHSFVLVDQLEYWKSDKRDALRWDLVSWIGGDYNRMWIKTEGEALTGGAGGELELFDVQYGRLIAPFWDLLTGIGYQRIWGSGSDPDRLYAVIGLQGLAPQWFQVDANLRLSEDGDLSADLEAEYDLLLTQRLILQPRFETELAAQKAEKLGQGQGFNSVRLGLRLRYEIRREVAPFIGVSWTRKLGETADFARADGEDTDDLSVVFGLRFWFDEVPRIEAGRCYQSIRSPFYP